MSEFEIVNDGHYSLWAAARGESVVIHIDGRKAALHEMRPNPFGDISTNYWSTNDAGPLRAGQRVWTEPPEAQLVVREMLDSRIVYDSHPDLRLNG